MKRTHQQAIRLLCDEEEVEKVKTPYPTQNTFPSFPIGILEIHHPICSSLIFNKYCTQIGLLLCRIRRSRSTIHFCDCVCGLSILLEKFWNDYYYTDLLSFASRITGTSIETIQQIERDVFIALGSNICTNDRDDNLFAMMDIR